MKTEDSLEIFGQDEKTKLLANCLDTLSNGRIHLKGLTGSSRALLTSAMYRQLETNHLIILQD
ncbi:MAG: hypothetical protein DRJ05_04175, partial [Bacteroidetes bacterium]